jgi:hypothetical protein
MLDLSLLLLYCAFVAPPAAAWIATGTTGGATLTGRQKAAVLLGPAIAGYVGLVVIWLLQSGGQCGPAEPYSYSFGPYPTETIFIGAMTIARPALFGITAGALVLAFCRASSAGRNGPRLERAP